ncbi:MAG: hypothetical protein HKN45_00775 [Flavobacteriales bacterium]|nr:hypothetical protein [Flavobacteriales bacterium]
MYSSTRLVFSLAIILTIGSLNSAPVQTDTVLISDLKPVDGILNLNGTPYTGEAYFIKRDGKPMVMRSYVKGVKQGLWRTWHTNGELYKEGHVKADKEHGEYREYYENGILRYHYHYDMGKKTGKWLGWYEDGTIYTERNFKDDKLNGRLVHYDEKGNARMSEEYREGRLIASDRFKARGEGVKTEGKENP